ncbi:putative nucleotidyltransferase [Escherichia coli O157 typing phage 13]|uniref:Thioredoxin n=6 Tax=Mosigvirus TaxID=1913652 RepID=A0A5B9N1H9_9CAUD|nr:nucleotidyltransferase [Escherichia coli O157 typing phage 3]YP_009593109.1 nucleotidyltransferase [Escherichia coli O157 typing phage 6]AKE46851.1 putative nucleotidyltransferase [Escherichia coli O157 typing phage 13]QEG05678.1 thioredoxin [Shigella phage JK36]QEG06215.1 thioredoxin [Shigella phage JK42]QGT55222.1 thioredoxin [Escherichia phage FP43]WLY86096.1 RNA repair pathway DNA polymerase beta [Escherichia phage 308Ecol101PP]
MKTIMKGYFGSHLYGTSTPESDVDFKEIYVPHARDILTGNVKEHMSKNTNNTSSKNTKDDVDHELYSLKYFFKLAADGETVALDMLHTPQSLVVKSDLPDVWKYIQDNRSRFYTTNMKSYLGYVRKQASKYGVKGSRLAVLRQALKRSNEWGQYFDNGAVIRLSHMKNVLPVGEFASWVETENEKTGKQTFYNLLDRKFQDTLTNKEFNAILVKLEENYGERARKAEANEGIDWKALSHACRGGLQLLEIYKTGDLVYPLQDAPFILDVKLGKHTFKTVQEFLEDIVDQVEHASEQAAKNGMQQKVDMSFWDDFLEQVYLENHNSYYK